MLSFCLPCISPSPEWNTKNRKKNLFAVGAELSFLFLCSVVLINSWLLCFLRAVSLWEAVNEPGEYVISVIILTRCRIVEDRKSFHKSICTTIVITILIEHKQLHRQLKQFRCWMFQQPSGHVRCELGLKEMAFWSIETNVVFFCYISTNVV